MQVTSFALTHIIPPELNFWFGHQGYEYLDLGRFWQLLLMVGLLLWLFLMLRCTVSAFKEKGTDKKPVGYLRSFYGRCGCVLRSWPVLR